MTAPRGWLAGVSALALAGLSACAATRATHPAAPADDTPPTAETTPLPARAALGAQSAPAPVTPSMAQPVPPPPANAHPLPTADTHPLPTADTHPLPTADAHPLPPCLPAHPKTPAKRRRHAKQPQGPELPNSARTRTDVAIDAQVGQIGASLASILGKNVVGPKGEDLGRVVDVLADEKGRVRVAIIDFGGFLGVGTRRIAVDWRLLRFNPDSRDKPLMLGVTRGKLQSAPEYKDSTSPGVLMPPAAASQDAADTGETKK